MAVNVVSGWVDRVWEFVTADWCYMEVVNIDQTVRNLICGDIACYGTLVHCV